MITLCDVVLEAPDNNEKLLFSDVLILLGQHCTGKKLYNIVHKATDNIAHQKVLVNFV